MLLSHKNEALIHATTWMTLENIKRNKLYTKKSNVWFYLYEKSRIGLLIETESRLVVTKDREVGVGNCCLIVKSFCLGSKDFRDGEDDYETLYL